MPTHTPGHPNAPCDCCTNGPSIAAYDTAAPPAPLVHPDEINEWVARTTELSVTETMDLASTFRHSSTERTRAAVASAIVKLEGKLPDQFRDCGSIAWVLQSNENPSHFRVATNKCRHRWCPACAAEKRRNAVWRLEDHLKTLPPNSLRLLTLTLRSSNDPLSEQIDRLYASFRKFRQRVKIAACIAGGVAFLELTYSEKLQAWHPHLHVMCTGTYLAQQLASQQWHDVTGDSYIVDIRAVRDRAALGYVAKYLGKSVPQKVYFEQALLCEAMTGLARRRSFFAFGSWRGLKLSETPNIDGEWTTVASLPSVILAARAGDGRAIMILRSLKGPKDDPVDLEHPPPPPTEVSDLSADPDFESGDVPF